jgi:predicted methyltransferase MtxX (methanogen marker protein 4)
MDRKRDTMSVEERKVSAASHRRSVAEEPVTSVLAGGEVPDLGRELTADEEVLAALGYMYNFVLLTISKCC